MKIAARARVVAGVVVLWIVAGLLLGGQAVLGDTIQGRPPASIAAVLEQSVVQMLPWIPVTLVAIAMAAAFPFTRRTWRRAIPFHVAAAVALSVVANCLVVLTFWVRSGSFRGLGLLLHEGVKWGAINLHVTFLIYAAVVGISTYVRDARERRERELRLAQIEGQLTRARLEALNAQIRPHFLFNTLHAIGQMWRSGRQVEADAMLDRLGSLFHRVLSSTSRLEIPLEEELELVQEYFAIEEARFRDRLTTRVDADAAARQCMVPPLILQPLVENAVRHGVAAMPEGGNVTVSARLVDGRLLLSVLDDGSGATGNGDSRGTGTGLRNTRERINEIYGPRASMRFEHPAAGGTIVSIELPATSELVNA